MYRSISAALLTVALSVSSSGLLAQDDAAAMYSPVLGEWVSEIETPRGAFTQEFAFTLDDGALTGVSSGRQGETPLSKVTFVDGTLTFEVERYRGGNSMTQTYTATIDGNTMTGTMSGRGGGGREFVATRKST